MTPAPRALKIYRHTWEWGSSATAAHSRGAPLRMGLGTMYFLFSWIYWGSLVYIYSAQFSLAAPTYEKDPKPTVVPFLNVYERSMCQVREILVDIYQEYPDEVEYVFKPSCIPLMRCAGCCSDETLECVPTETSNITMQILRVKPHVSGHYVDKSFQQHTQCACSQKKEIKDKQEKKAKRGKGHKRKRKKIRYKSHRFHCEPCTDTERRKHLFVQDPQTCKCSCKNTDSRCKTKQLELNERTCRRGTKSSADHSYAAPYSADLAH